MYYIVLYCTKLKFKLAATLWWFTAAPKPLKIEVFWGSPSPQGSHSPYILGNTTKPGHVTCVLVWSKSDRKRLRKTLHKQTNKHTDKQTDTTKIMVTWPWTNIYSVPKSKNGIILWRSTLYRKRELQWDVEQCRSFGELSLHNCTCVMRPPISRRWNRITYTYKLASCRVKSTGVHGVRGTCNEVHESPRLWEGKFPLSYHCSNQYGFYGLFEILFAIS